MNINTFLTIYNTKKTLEEKEKFVKEHIKDSYIPYENKIAVAKTICDGCYWIKETDDDGSEFSRLYVNSPAKHMLSSMSIVDLYTDIERSPGGEKILDDYNVLVKCGALDFIVTNINQRELKEFTMVLQMTCEDVIANEYENHAYITKQVDRFGKLVGVALGPVLEKLDMEKVKEVVGEMTPMG